MLLKVKSASVLGVEAEILDIEVDLSVHHLTRYHVVGLPDTAVRESGERVKAAIRNCGYPFPRTGAITVNLAPADFKKEGSCFDLPIALAILGLVGELEPEKVADWLILGELSLDGRVRPIRGALPVALSAQRKGFRRLLVPSENAEEAAIVKEIEVYPARSLPQVLGLLSGSGPEKPFEVSPRVLEEKRQNGFLDLADVRGQISAKRALEVACAGGHNLLMIGAPGAGKTMLARRIPTILPPLSFDEALQTTAIHSVCGLLKGERSFVSHRPFRAPHHTISGAGLVGGTSNPRPGEVSLANNGVLFLDELTEFKRHVLEVLRQPLEEGEITISRAARTLTFPARFMLAAAMNPCPCGYRNSLFKDCLCTPMQIHRYVSKISGPLLDRIDLHIEVPEVKYGELTGERDGETSEVVAARIRKVRRAQMKRFRKLEPAIFCNAQMGARETEAYCRLDSETQTLLRNAIEKLGFSARTYSRILKVSRTIADLDEEEKIQAAHVSEAIQYRSLDRNYWQQGY